MTQSLTKLGCLGPLATGLFTFTPRRLGKHYLRMQCEGVPAVRPQAHTRSSKTRKHVSRADGGSRCAKRVRDKIKCASLLRSRKMVVKVLKA